MRINEEQKKERYSTVIILVLISCVCLIVQMYTLPYKRVFWMALSNRTMLIMWFATMIYTYLKYGTRRMMTEIGLFIFVIIAFWISVSGKTQKFSTSFTAMMNFIAMPMMMIYFAHHKPDERSKKILLVTNFILSLVFISLSRTNMAYRFEGTYFNLNIDELTLGYPNPNQTAMYLFACALNLMVGVFYFKNSLVKFLYGADFVYMLMLLEKTKCRTSLLLIGVFLVLIVIHKVPKLVVEISVLLPAIYALIAQFMYKQFGNITFMNESLFNGRENLYDRYFDHLDLFKFVFGDFTRFDFENLHNAYISIAATVGIFALILYVLMIRKHLLGNLKLGVNKGYERVAFIGFICLIMYSSTESAGLTGGTNYAFLNVSLLMYFSKGFAGDGTE